MMMYQHLDAPYYDDEMELDDPSYYDAEEELYNEATRPYRWVRPGYGNHRPQQTSPQFVFQSLLAKNQQRKPNCKSVRKR